MKIGIIIMHKPRHMFMATSNGYRDRDGENVTVEALGAYVKAFDAGRAAPQLLDFGHGPVIGEIVAAEMWGPWLVEIAKEAASPVAKMFWDLIESTSGGWGCSQKFYNVAGGKANGVIRQIRKTRSTVLRRERAANTLTLAGIIKGYSNMSDFKKTLAKLLGGGQSQKEQVEKWQADFIELANRAPEGVNLKALIDEDTGETIEPGDIAAAASEAVIAVLAEADIEAPENLPSALAQAIEAFLPSTEEVIDGEAMKAFAGAVTGAIGEMTGVGDDIGALTEAQEKSHKLIEAMAGQVLALTGEVAAVKAQVAQRAPASKAAETTVDPDAFAETLKNIMKEATAAPAPNATAPTGSKILGGASAQI